MRHAPQTICNEYSRQENGSNSSNDPSTLQLRLGYRLGGVLVLPMHGRASSVQPEMEDPALTTGDRRQATMSYDHETPTVHGISLISVSAWGRAGTAAMVVNRQR